MQPVAHTKLDRVANGGLESFPHSGDLIVAYGNERSDISARFVGGCVDDEIRRYISDFD